MILCNNLFRISRKTNFHTRKRKKNTNRLTSITQEQMSSNVFLLYKYLKTILIFDIRLHAIFIMFLNNFHRIFSIARPSLSKQKERF